MAASAPKARRKPAKNQGRARRGLGLAGASMFATTGILGAYVGYPGLRRAQALTACSAVTNEATLNTALTQAATGTPSACDYIYIPAGTITLTNNLSAVTLTGSSLTIKGAGQGSTVIDGVSAYKGFDFGKGGAAADVTISSLTIQYTSGSNSTAVNLAPTIGGTLTLDSVSLLNNSGNSAAISGGYLNVTNSTFTDNNATTNNGGALYSYYAPVISGSTFSTNQATNGGAVSSFNGIQVSSDSRFIGNSAAEDGGALYSYGFGSGITITESTFTGNTAGESGGAAFLYYSGLNVQDSTFSGNTASYSGGAIEIYDYNDSGSTITSSTFSGNAANYGGGGFYGGGAIYTKGATDVVNSTFVGNSGYDGAAIKGYSNDVSINFSTITSNTSAGGASVYVFSVSAVTIANSILYGNLDSMSSTANDAISAGTLTVSNSLLTSANSRSAAGTVTTSDLIEDEDPLLGSLANNGGPTQTMLPAADSPVIGMADPSGAPATDQRGFTRTTNGLADMGSVERGGAAPEPDLSQMPPAWFQAQQRQEQSAVCPPGMHASWAEWPNEQTGGWTCEWSTWWDVNKGTAGGWVTTPGFNPGLRVSD